ncbi:hypothetical protein BDV96DRAFT_472331, partial [Lophiotrema nucula]
SSHSPTSPNSNEECRERGRKRVSAEHTLNRVRENQRRHRARRKDYITTLEEKLAETQKLLDEALAEIARLRGEREGHECNEVVVFKCELTHNVDGEDTEPRAIGRIEDVRMEPDDDQQLVALPSPPDTASMSMESFTLSISRVPTPMLPVPSGPPPCCKDELPDLPAEIVAPAGPECSTCKTRPPPAPTESTTLCSQAYIMIAQQNFRGIDAGTIRTWLFQGYRRAQREGEGCRVENGALFRLLDYISGI